VNLLGQTVSAWLWRSDDTPLGRCVNPDPPPGCRCVSAKVYAACAISASPLDKPDFSVLEALTGKWCVFAYGESALRPG
jgi:hypothetical protein